MDATTWLWSGGWGSPVGVAIFMAGLGVFFAGFGLFLSGVGRLNQTKLAEEEAKKVRRTEGAP
jgi:hypothetical protein